MSPQMIAIVIAAISYLASSRNGASGKQALATAALAGFGTYAVATETEWGQKTFPPKPEAATPLTTASGETAVYPNGSTAKTGGSLTSWLSSNAAPLAVGAAAGTTLAGGSLLPWLIGGAALLLLLK